MAKHSISHDKQPTLVPASRETALTGLYRACRYLLIGHLLTTPSLKLS